ncbi:MAG: hypothetical protein QUS11_07310 [Candidatus Fermentibacter sp.]|nr:hypothetical protein [Candidatus Fermentibacter sp.]
METWGSSVVMAAVLMLSVAGSAAGQWSADSLGNLEVCDAVNEQSVPKIAPTSDGGCFVSWFDSRSGGYCLYLQRIDADGNELFDPDGLLISDHEQQSWLVDYDMAVDAGDNAVIVFSDTRNTPDELDVSAYRISSEGEFLWGPDGVCLSNPSESSFEAAPTVAVTPAGNSIFAWGGSGSDYTMTFQKLSSSGDRLWGDWGITVNDPVRSLSMPIVVPSGQDSAIVLFKSSTGSYPSQVTWLYAGLLDASGGWGWDDTPVLVYNSGDISPWSVPEIVPDGEDGAVMCWYDAADLSTFEVWVQHVDASGDLLFPANGAQASTNSDDRLHMNPSAFYWPAQDRTLVFWVEENDNQNQYGVYGQMFSSAGARLWTDGGLALVPLGSSQISFVRPLGDPDGAYVAYFRGSGSTSVRVLRIGYDGSPDWGPVTISAASLGGKDDLVQSPGCWGSGILAWCDNRNDYGIYAQNINPDGTMGPPTGVETEPGLAAPTLAVTANPAIGCIDLVFSTPAAGEVSLLVFDLSGRSVATLVDGALPAGEHEASWAAGEGMPAGVYMAVLRAGGRPVRARMVLL